MNRQSSFLIVALIAVCAVLIGLQLAGDSEAQSGMRWEYRTVYFAAPLNGNMFQAQFMDLEDGQAVYLPDEQGVVMRYLNQLGSEGWEMVSAPAGNSVSSDYFIFKRPLQ